VKDVIKAAEKLGVKRSQFYNIINKKSWSDL
jgi:predicted DNA-binding transcriptional regulator AlpA